VLKEALIAGTLLRHAIQSSAGRFEEIRRRGAVLQPGNRYERFGAIHVNFSRRKIVGRSGALARVKRILKIARPRRHGGYWLRVGKIWGAVIAFGTPERMRAYPDKPAEKKDHNNRNGDPHVGRNPNGAATASAAMMMMAMVTSMSMRAAGRDPGSQVDAL
jgi:hypothetical protein